MIYFFGTPLFYDRLLQEGLTIEEQGQAVGNEQSTRRNQEAIEWVKKQLAYHSDLTTDIWPTKEIIKAKLSRVHMSNEVALSLLNPYLENAEKQLEECRNWYLVDKKTSEEIAIQVISEVSHNSPIPFLDDKDYRILKNYQRAYAWNNFVNWLSKQIEIYATYPETKSERKDTNVVLITNSQSTYIQEGLSNNDNVPDPVNEKEKNKRGPYKTDRSAVIDSFEYLVRDAIMKTIKKSGELDEGKIIRDAYAILTKKKQPNNDPLYKERTLRHYLPTLKKRALFGKICQQILEISDLKNK